MHMKIFKYLLAGGFQAPEMTEISVLKSLFCREELLNVRDLHSQYTQLPVFIHRSAKEMHICSGCSYKQESKGHNLNTIEKLNSGWLAIAPETFCSELDKTC